MRDRTYKLLFTLAVTAIILMAAVVTVASVGELTDVYQEDYSQVETDVIESSIEETEIADTNDPTESIEVNVHETAANPTEEITVQEEVIAETEQTEPPVVETEPAEQISSSGWTSLGTFKLTAYCPCANCCGSYTNTTSTGVTPVAGVTIAVDPSVIPYGTEVQIYGHTYIAQDTGGAIGGGRIDIFFNSHQEALNFGVQYAEVYVYR